MNFTVNLPINDEEKLEEHRLLYICAKLMIEKDDYT